MQDNSDPLIAALFAKLPTPGTNWPEERQQAWLKMMAMGLSVVYGGSLAEPDAPVTATPPTNATTPKPAPPKIKYQFMVDEQGFAVRANGKRIMPSDISDVLYDLRGEEGDLRAIIWADESTGPPKGIAVSAVQT